MFNFERLEVWRKALDLTKAVYILTKKLPKEEIFGITSQIKRASFSIASNIAEGSGRKHKKEFKHFLSISYGSLCETITLLRLLHELTYISQEKYSRLYSNCEELAKMLSGLSNSLVKPEDMVRVLDPKL